jgi:signal transduction histidine kinase/CheY-like chemotaxis protein
MIIGLLIAASGIMMWSGVLHIAIGIRRRGDPVNLTYGFTTLAFAGFTVCGAAIAQVETLDRAGPWIFGKVSFALLAWLGVIAFSWAFLRRGHAWPWLMSLVGVALLVHFVLPGGIYVQEILAIRTDVMPWGEEIQRVEFRTRPFALPILLAMVGSLGYAIKRAALAYRTELGHRPIVYLMGLALLALALVDDLVRVTALTYAVDESAMILFTLLMGTYLVEDAADTVEARTSARMSMKRMQALIDTAPEAILIYDPEGGSFVHTNEPARELFGLDLTGRSWLEFSTRAPAIQPDGYAGADRAAAVLREAHQGTSQPIEWSVLDAAGEVIPCELRVVALHEDRGDLIRVSLIDLRPVQEADHRRRLAEEQLHHAQRLEALGQMTSRIAHDLSNILTPIMARADLALGRYGPQDPRLKEDLEEIVKASERARDLAGQVLRFTRRSQGQGNVSDVSNVVRSLMSLLRTAAPPGVVVQSVIKETCVARISRQHAEQVVSNLAVNAIHACRESGHVRITVGCTRVSGPLAQRHPDYSEPTAVRISVQDNGVGIPENLMSRILEPYYTTKGEEGTGLGLSIVNDLVREAGGSIAVESRPGEGTTFEILLALAGQEARVRPARPEPPSAAWSGSALVVEDDPWTRTAVGQLLDALGFEVVTADTVAAARSRLDGAHFRLVVTDVELPDGDGEEVARCAGGGPEPVALLFMTGSGASIRDDEPGPALVKPFSLHELAEAVSWVMPRDAHATTGA